MAKLIHKELSYTGGGGGGVTTAILYFISDSTFEDYGVRATPLLSNVSPYVTTLNALGNGYLEVDGQDRYKIDLFHEEEVEGETVEVIDYTTYVVANCGCFYYLDIGLTTATWAGVKRIVDLHRASEFITNGDQFPVTLSTGQEMIFEANVNTYGLDEVDFIPKTVVDDTVIAMRTDNQNTGGYPSATIFRDYLNDTFLKTLPVDLQNIIVAKTIYTSYGGGSTTIVSCVDKIWAPTSFELASEWKGTSAANIAEADYNIQYPIFTDAQSRVRYASDGTPKEYHLASPYNGSYYYNYVTSAGSWSYRYASNVIDCVLPCFRIAPTVEPNA